MRAILIDPHTQLITEIELPSGKAGISHLDAMHNLIGCRTLDAVKVDRRNYLWLDDEGLYVPNQAYFELPPYPQPLAGRAIVLGLDKQGDSTDTKMMLDWWKMRVRWPEIEFDHLYESQGTVQWGGKKMHQLTYTPVFRPKHEDDKS